MGPGEIEEVKGENGKRGKIETAGSTAHWGVTFIIHSGATSLAGNRAGFEEQTRHNW